MGDLAKKLQDMGAGQDFAGAVGFAEDIYSKEVWLIPLFPPGRRC